MTTRHLYREMLVNIHSPEFCCGCRALTKTRPLIRARSSLAPAHCLPGVGRVWCALPKGLVCPLQEGRVWCALSRKVWCALPKGLVCPLQEGRVWCALSRRGGSGVPSPRVWCAPSRRGGSGVPSPGRSGVPSPCREESGVPHLEASVWCAIPSKMYSLYTRGVALVNTKLSPSCLINKLWRSSYK